MNRRAGLPVTWEPTSYRPSLWLPGGHLQTVVPSVWPVPAVPAPFTRRWVEVGPGSSVLLRVNRPESPPRGTLLLVHGMGGCAESNYMRDTAREALARGWVALRMNLRNCGGTERRSRTLYNAGQSGDADRVLADLGQHEDEYPRPHVAAGFSLGANLVLRYGGRSAERCRADALAAVNPPVDLEHCMQALERPANRIYQRHYVVRLCAQVRAVRRVRTLDGPAASPRQIGTLRNFDSRFTAPDAGYGSVDEYYADASAGPWLSGLRRPALILSARNDPFVPVGMFTAHHGHELIRFVHPEQGGHCGYWQRGRPRCWAAETVMDFFEAAC